MDIDVLKEFVSLYETCSFQETSEDLHISQSSLTKHIHKLEEDLGVKLFDRSTRSVSLNEYSRLYYDYANRLIKLDAESREALTNAKSKNANTLRIFFTPSTSHYGLIDVLSYFQKKHPEIDLQMSEQTKVTDDIKEGNCEFAFASDNDMIDPKLTKIIYQKDELAIIVPAKHRLAEKEFVTFDDIKDERFVLHSNSTGGMQIATKQLLELFEKNNATINVGLYAGPERKNFNAVGILWYAICGKSGYVVTVFHKLNNTGGKRCLGSNVYCCIIFLKKL